MQRILLVDDSPTSRNLLATVLESAGYAIIEASSGEEALRRAAQDDPDLVITDIVMPSMDGFEFVARLRADSERRRLPVIFYSGVKHEREARALARSCGVAHLIPKPSDPETIRSAVASALAAPEASPLPAPDPTPVVFDRDIHRLLSDELSDVMADRESTYLRIAGLIEIGRVLSSHRDPNQLLQAFGEMARDLLGARLAAVGLRAVDGTPARLYTVGLDAETEKDMGVEPRSGVLRKLLDFDGSIRVQGVDADPAALGLPDSHPVMTAFLGVPILTLDAIHGWFYAGHTRPEARFSDDDERLATTLARQLAVAYDNARLYSQLQQEFRRAQTEVEERRRAEDELRIRVRQLGTLEQLSERALAGAEWPALLRETARRVMEAANSDYCNILELLPDGERLVLVASAARHGDDLMDARPIIVTVEPPATHTLAASEPVVTPRVFVPELDQRGVQASVSVAIPGTPRPYGLVALHRRDAIPFVERDSQFIQSVANLLAASAERRRAEEQLRSSHQQLRELASRLQSVREDERTHIAREIHDELGQSLTALKMELSWVGKSLTREGVEKVMPKIRSMSELIDQTIHQVRRLSTELRPGVLDHLGLVAAVEWQTEEFKTRTGIDCEVRASLNDQGLSDDRCTAIFRILQETLTNVARHANASRVSVSLKQEDDNLVLEVQDNGKGFDNEGARFTSLGLLGMRERALLLGGELYISSVPGKGSRIAVKIPFRGDLPPMESASARS
jgi:signal transduction histidine kinase/CheY-like chemotaxis protein